MSVLRKYAQQYYIQLHIQIKSYLFYSFRKLFGGIWKFKKKLKEKEKIFCYDIAISKYFSCTRQVILENNTNNILVGKIFSDILCYIYITAYYTRIK